MGFDANLRGWLGGLGPEEEITRAAARAKEMAAM